MLEAIPAHGSGLRTGAQRSGRATWRWAAVWVVAFGGACPAQLTEPPADPGAGPRGSASRESASAEAQEPAGANQDGLAQPVKQLLAEPYLTEEEKRDLRLKHGVWTAPDLDTPQRRAVAALTRGDYLDASLFDASVDVLTRAEAMVRRGELEEALELARAGASARAARIRVESLWELGRYGEARAEATKLLTERRWMQSSADEIADGVRALSLLTRLGDAAGPADNASSYRSLMALLAEARDKVDRFSWAARLAEARLLDEKDNLGEAVGALRQALEYNPRNAETWALAGRFAVLQFNLERAEFIANALDALAAGAEIEAAHESSNYPASLRGAIVRASGRLRASDGPGAMSALEAALARFPRSRELLAWRAAAAASEFDAEKTAELLANFDSLSPGSADAVLEVGRVLAAERQYAEAAGYLEEAARRAPGWCDPVIELGLLEVQAGRDDRALTALQKAVALDPFNTRAGNSLKLVQELRTFATIESPHFIVRYKPGMDEVLAGEMPSLLEEMYARVTGDGDGGIDYEPPGKTVIELMPDHHWFSVRITGMPRVHTIAASTGPVVAMETPREGPGHLVGPYDWLRVVRHEFTHTVTLSRTKNRLPHWFTEAAAVYLEDAPRDDSTCRVLAQALETGSLFNLDNINTAFVRPVKPTDRSQAYAQGHWMYEYIVRRWGAKAPLELMDRYAAGDREAVAMQSVLGVSREDFLEQFKTWAAGQLIDWGMNPRAGVPTIRELLAKERKTEGGEGDSSAAAASPSAPPAPPTKEMVDRWLVEYPEHPDVLRLAVAFEMERTGGKADAAMVPLLERYAKARPVDSLPHKLLARLYLDEPSGGAEAARASIPHLEFLDIREQHSAVYAMQLAKSYATLGDWTRAWEKAQRATRVDPFNPATRELAASVALKRNDLPAAERQIVALTKIEPDREIHQKRLDAVRAKMKS